ncbi:MAG: hypothetical protein IPH31_22025 [Lewinellaceae bacterium]|nr:hypothetical protein [Lewinellaceae bacterium]
MTKAQSVIPDTTTRLFWVPLLFYSPDTKIGGGAAGVVTFVGSPFRSSITFGLAYTQRKQFLIYFPYQLYSQNQKWRLYGEIGWYRFFYQYYGIGNKYPNSFSEGFTAKFPRVRSTLLRHINGPQFAGVRLFLDDFDIVEIAEAGEIAQGNDPGAKGGLASSLGAVWLLDTRDIQFYPGDGWLNENAKIRPNLGAGLRFEFDRKQHLHMRLDYGFGKGKGNSGAYLTIGEAF